MPAERMRVRQDPVSCAYCRKKKLRCNREHPCSNCQSRSLACEFEGHWRPPISDQNEEVTLMLRAENAAIRSRLAKLEDIVLSRPAGNTARRTTDATTPSSLLTPGNDLEDATLPASYDNPEAVESYENDLQLLESVGTAGTTNVSYLSHRFVSRIVPSRQFAQLSQDVSHDGLLIPLLEETASMDLFDFYADHLDPAQHILYLPTVRSAFRRLFEDIANGTEIDPNRTVLLLSIYATVAIYWAYSDRESMSLFQTSEEAKTAGFSWLRTTLDVLEHVRRSGTATLETVQATIFVVFLLYRLDGLSPRARALHGSAIVLAKDLGLHNLDSRGDHSGRESQPEIIDREIKRRVWWHLAATDWSLSMVGPHGSTYSIHPKQMKVHKPRDISDEELSTQSEDFVHSTSRPTIMTYSLQRIRLGEVSQQVADLSYSTSPAKMKMFEIWQVENEFASILARAPAVLQLDSESSPKTADLNEHNKTFALQRYIFNITLHARRCKFHGPFVLRAAHDIRYVPFRTACLQAARAIVQAHKGLSSDQSFLNVANSSLNDIIHHFFYATVVLVMDFCIHRGTGEEAASKEEIRDACRVLEAAKSQPGAASIFLDSLMSILKKRRVKLQEQEHSFKSRNNEHLELPPRSFPEASGDANMTGVTGLEGETSLVDLDFDQLWQSFIELDSIDVQSWDALMNDIDVVY